VQELAGLGDLDRDVTREELRLRGQGGSLALVFVHRERRRVGDRARGGDPGSHPPEVILRQLELDDGSLELRALLGVLGRLLERGLRDAARASTGLQAAGGEAGHLQVEAAAFSVRAADQVRFRNEIVFEAQRERVHAAVAGGSVGLALHLSATGLRHGKRVPPIGFLRNDEE
jgi:hypothetical protein